MHSCPHMNLNILLSELSSDKEISRNARTWAHPHPTGNAHTGNGNKKGGDAQSDAITSPLMSEDFLLLLGDIIITKPMESAEGLEGSSGVYVNCVSHFWQDPDHEQVTLKCKIIFLIYFLQHHKPHCMNNSPTSGL